MTLFYYRSRLHSHTQELRFSTSIRIYAMLSLWSSGTGLCYTYLPHSGTGLCYTYLPHSGTGLCYTYLPQPEEHERDRLTTLEVLHLGSYAMAFSCDTAVLCRKQNPTRVAKSKKHEWRTRADVEAAIPHTQHYMILSVHTQGYAIRSLLYTHAGISQRSVLYHTL